MMRSSPEAIEFDGGLVLLDPVNQRLVAYNETARAVWLALADGRAADSIVDDLSDAASLPKDAVARDVEGLVQHWRSEGLVDAPDGAPPQSSQADAVDWSSAPEPRWAAKWTCRLRDLTVSFAVEPPALVPVVRTLLRPLECSGAAPDMRLEIRDTGRGDAALIEDGVERMRASQLGAFKDSSFRAIIERLYPDRPWCMLVHAGAVARRGKGIAFPADTGAGKTTLIAHLMTYGYEYLADDLLPLAGPDGTISPWPVPLSVKSRSWPVLARAHPQLMEAPIFRTKGDEARLLVPPDACWTAPRVPLSAIIFPRFAPEAEPRWRVVRPLEALAHILRGRIWLGDQLHPDRVRHLLRWIADAHRYELVFRSVGDAAQMMEALPS